MEDSKGGRADHAVLRAARGVQRLMLTSPNLNSSGRQRWQRSDNGRLCGDEIVQGAQERRRSKAKSQNTPHSKARWEETEAIQDPKEQLK